MARFWPKDSETIIGSIHIQVSFRVLDRPGTLFANKIDEIVDSVQESLKRKISGLKDITVQVELAHRPVDS